MGKNDAARRRREQRLGVRIQEIRKAEYAAGVERGKKEGAAATLEKVLEHAGDLFMRDLDAAGRAVREVHHSIRGQSESTTTTVNAEKSRG